MIVRFVDTNILLYAISKDPAEARKAQTAQAILESRDLALSVQVIQEFFFQTTRSDRSDALSYQQALGLIQSFMRFPIQDVGMAVVLLAMATSREFQISYWDAAIIEAARVMKCGTVLSEDLSHGQDYGGVLVVNPFESPPDR
jgi:predicted nucleic acid-binding protein